MLLFNIKKGCLKALVRAKKTLETAVRVAIDGRDFRSACWFRLCLLTYQPINLFPCFSLKVCKFMLMIFS